MRSLLATLTALALAAAVAGCGAISTASTTGTSVVAAENFWGSIAKQIGGNKANVQSIITNPAQDPHSYEPTAEDARVLVTAQLAIINGAGYDPWASRLLGANPAPGRLVLNVGGQFGLREGDNPHVWYDPADVETIAENIATDLRRIDPQNADYYRHQLGAFETTGLKQYLQLIAQIKGRYAGVPVGASESIFALQAPALGLHLTTPDSFMTAIAEGTDVNPQDISTVQDQITHRQIKLWIYNAQNATPQIQQLNALARANHIPVVTITETLSPATATFQQWQVAQLEAIERALQRATGR